MSYPKQIVKSQILPHVVCLRYFSKHTHTPYINCLVLWIATKLNAVKILLWDTLLSHRFGQHEI